MVGCAYFSALDDAAALGVLDRPGGPHGSAFDTRPPSPPPTSVSPSLRPFR